MNDLTCMLLLLKNACWRIVGIIHFINMLICICAVRPIEVHSHVLGLRQHLLMSICTASSLASLAQKIRQYVMRAQTQAESSVPLLINCWPSASGSESYVNIEYECTVDFDLHNVAIVIPIPSTGSAPRINSVPPHCALSCYATLSEKALVFVAGQAVQ